MKIIKVDFSQRVKDLRYLNKIRKEEKKEKRIEYRIRRLVNNSMG